MAQRGHANECFRYHRLSRHQNGFHFCVLDIDGANKHRSARGAQPLHFCHQHTLFIVLLLYCCSGESVCENLSAMGVKLVTSNTEAEMRLCTSLVDERFGETTEIIEPWSAEVRLSAVGTTHTRSPFRRPRPLRFVLIVCYVLLNLH